MGVGISAAGAHGPLRSTSPNHAGQMVQARLTVGGALKGAGRAATRVTSPVHRTLHHTPHTQEPRRVQHTRTPDRPLTSGGGPAARHQEILSSHDAIRGFRPSEVVIALRTRASSSPPGTGKLPHVPPLYCTRTAILHREVEARGALATTAGKLPASRAHQALRIILTKLWSSQARPPKRRVKRIASFTAKNLGDTDDEARGEWSSKPPPKLFSRERLTRLRRFCTDGGHNETRGSATQAAHVWALRMKKAFIPSSYACCACSSFRACPSWISWRTCASSP